MAGGSYIHTWGRIIVVSSRRAVGEKRFFFFIFFIFFFLPAAAFSGKTRNTALVVAHWGKKKKNKKKTRGHWFGGELKKEIQMRRDAVVAGYNVESRRSVLRWCGVWCGECGFLHREFFFKISIEKVCFAFCIR